MDETFCSSSTDRALDLLGDLAFEQGRFGEAERRWRMLVLPAAVKDRGQKEEGDLLLVFPDLRSIWRWCEPSWC